MSYINPEDLSQAYVVKFMHKDEEIQQLKKFIVDQFELKDVEKAEHKGGDTTRKSSIIWFNDKTISGILFNAMKIAAYEAGWHYEITGHETLQMTRYEEGDEYAWHSDGEGCAFNARSFDFEQSGDLDKTSSPGLLGSIRKLSATIVVNDDYEGGHFETMRLDHGKVIKRKVEAAPGSAIVFPSSTTHRVTPVTKGIRYSIVVWFAGPPFK